MRGRSEGKGWNVVMLVEMWNVVMLVEMWNVARARVKARVIRSSSSSSL